MNESHKNRMEKMFGGAEFDVEHAISMYAYSFCTLPAQFIYDKDALEKFSEVLTHCHIYFIGYLPTINIIDVNQMGNRLKVEIDLAEVRQEFELPIPDNFTLDKESEVFTLLRDDGERFIIPQEMITEPCSSSLNFDVRYIGQAYGKDGSRNAIDRLLKHETLQKISLKGVPKGHTLSLILFEVQENKQLVTMLNPFAKNKDDGQRIKAGIDKLLDTNKQELISLYEAAFIRYFSPQFNKEFKNSFPSTNLKILQDCYDKDFSAVIAEISIDDLPFSLGSDVVEPSNYHCANHPLHKDEARKAFFFGESKV